MPLHNKKISKKESFFRRINLSQDNQIFRNKWGHPIYIVKLQLYYNEND